MNNSTDYVIKYNHPYKFWVTYAWPHNDFCVYGKTTIGPAK